MSKEGALNRCPGWRCPKPGIDFSRWKYYNVNKTNKLIVVFVGCVVFGGEEGNG
jgi:hypothetical protein